MKASGSLKNIQSSKCCTNIISHREHYIPEEEEEVITGCMSQVQLCEELRFGQRSKKGERQVEGLE